jgi:hypothetical protein
MGKSNTVIGRWMSDGKRFASFVNGALFQGKPIFQEKHLKTAEGAQKITLKDTDGKSVMLERFRDITKVSDDGTRIVIIGCENQDEIHYAMPVRNMLYDAVDYAGQVTSLRKQHRKDKDLKGSAEFLSGLKKTDVLYPVITIVFYYGENEWDGHQDLYGLLGMDRDEYKILRKYVPNYKINLIDPRNIEDLSCFEEDLQMVFGMLKYRKNKEELLSYVNQNRKYWESVDEDTRDVVKVLLKAEDLLRALPQNETGGVNMCQALEELYQDGVNEGIRQSVHAVIREYSGDGYDEEYIVKKLVNIFSLSPEKAKDYYDQSKEMSS